MTFILYYTDRTKIFVPVKINELVPCNYHKRLRSIRDRIVVWYHCALLLNFIYIFLITDLDCGLRLPTASVVTILTTTHGNLDVHNTPTFSKIVCGRLHPRKEIKLKMQYTSRVQFTNEVSFRWILNSRDIHQTSLNWGTFAFSCIYFSCYSD